jgi:hypothetical protein
VIEIMIHGRMYLSNKRICFRSNILGVRTKVSRVPEGNLGPRELALTGDFRRRRTLTSLMTQREIPIKHIHAIVLKNVAGMIPNSFEVQANDKKVRSSVPSHCAVNT